MRNINYTPIDYAGAISENAREERAKNLLDCDLVWSHPDEIIGALMAVRSQGEEFAIGAMRSEFGFGEYLSQSINRVLSEYREELQQARNCSAAVADATLKCALSAAAASWCRELTHTNFDTELILLCHEYHIVTRTGSERFRFLSAIYNGTVTYCAFDELPVIDYEVGDNQKRLRSIAEKWELK